MIHHPARSSAPYESDSNVVFVVFFALVEAGNAILFFFFGGEIQVDEISWEF